MTAVLHALNQAMHRSMESDPLLFFLGEDILDPYGGAFKVASGLSTRFPDRVLTTPISEAAFTGVGVGLALGGCRAVIEIMFGDFLTLTADMLINSASRFRWMYNDQVRVPIVVRTPMGGRRGYGPTHSQSLEKHWLGIPGLRVVAPHAFADPGALLEHAIQRDDDPVLFVEHKLLYGRPVREGECEQEFLIRRPSTLYGATCLVPPGEAAVTFACYGYMAELVFDAMARLLFDYEIFCEAVIFSELSPLAIAPLLTSLRRTRRLVTVEEGTAGFDWGAEVVGSAVAAGAALTDVRRIAALPAPVPASRVLEELALPSVDSVVAATLQMLGVEEA